MKNNYPVPLANTVVDVITDDIRDIQDVAYLYEDGATSRPDYVGGGQFIGDIVPPGWTIRDTAIVEMIKKKEVGIEAAMAVQNAHARAVAVDACGGWEKFVGKPVHEDAEGALYAVEWLATKILKVVCPSTKETYYLHVPAEMTTAKEARLWVNRGIKPELES